jgi:hypothetical protein
MLVPLLHAGLHPDIVMAGADWAASLTTTLLGAFHGVNPAMGWLFAVFLALQRRQSSVLLTALAPITAGHAASIAAVALPVLLLQSTLATGPMRLLTALLLLGFGAYKLLTRLRHPRWVGLNVGYRDLAWWSFLMATAHGSGLMLAPVLLGQPGAEFAVGLVVLHTLAMLAVMAAVALVVYYRVGIAALQRYWINFDLLWTLALLGAGTLALTGLLVAPAH